MNSRQKQILELLHTSDQSIKSLASRFGVTEMTVRRDLKALSDHEGVIVSCGQVMLYDKLQKSSEDAETEAAAVVRANIAEALYHRIFPMETLFLSGGRTTLAFARYLASHCTSPVTVVTNSLAIASTLFCVASFTPAPEYTTVPRWLMTQKYGVFQCVGGGSMSNL